MRRLMIATALMLAAPLVAAQAYKWTDASGTVHYSDAPPPQGTKYNKVTTTGTVEPLAAPPAASSSSDTSNNANPPASNQPMTDTPENRAKMCASLKSNLGLLNGGAPVTWQNNGKQEVMSADQRKEQASAAQAQYQQYCSGS